MEYWREGLGIAIIGWTLLYLSIPLWIWSVIVGIVLSVFCWIFRLSATQVGITVGFFSAYIFLFHVGYVRKCLVAKPIFRWFQAALPPISQTESEAILAGNVWWDGELFQGNPNWNKLLSETPAPKLSHEEEKFLTQETEILCEMLEDWKITHEDYDLPAEVWTYLKEKKFFGMMIPKIFGGLGFSALGNSTIVHKITSKSVSAAITVMVPNSLGPAELLLHYGTEHQKNYYLPRLAMGEEVPCFGLTSVQAGSDATAMLDKGIVCRDLYEGKEIIGIRLTWSKRYITLAPVATVLGLAFKLFDPDKLLGNETSLGITVCLIPTSHPGVEIGNRHFPLNQTFMNGPTRGENVFIPLDWIIGGSAMIGKGWKMLVESLSAGRGISLPAVATGIGKLCYRTTGAYASIREQFNLSIGLFGGVAEAMARIAGLTYIMEAARLLTVAGIDQHQKPAVVTAIAKYHMTEMARKIITDAMDIHGGRSIMMGPRNYLARPFQSIPISVTVEGANILTRSLIIFGQGAIRCHPYVYKEIQAIMEPDKIKAIAKFDALIFAHIKYTLSNVVRLLTNSWFCGFFCHFPKQDKINKRYYRKLSYFSLALAVVSDVSLLILGGKLKRLERLSARLGDVLSHLYLGSAVLKYQNDKGLPEDDKPFVQWALEWSLFHAETAFLEFFRNFPNKFIAFILKKMIFPYGRKYALPNDKLGDRLVKSMMTNNLFRDRLTAHCYRGKSHEDALGGLEAAFASFIETAPLRSKLKKSVLSHEAVKNSDWLEQLQFAKEKSILSEQEIQDLMASYVLCQNALEVDEFIPEQLVWKKAQ